MAKITTEAAFEEHVEAVLLKTHGFLPAQQADYDKALCLRSETVISFIRATQTKKWLLTSRTLVIATGRRLKLQQLDQTAALQTLDKIGVGTAHWIAPPLPPNRTGRFPASGSPVSIWLR